MEPGGITEDQCSRRPFENQVLGCGDLAFHFSVGGIGILKRISPWKHMLIGSSHVTTNEIFHGAVVGIDLVEIEKCPYLSMILRVAMPSLRGDARFRIERECVPHVKVNQL